VLATVLTVTAWSGVALSAEYTWETTNFYGAYDHLIWSFHYQWDEGSANPWTESAQWTWTMCHDWGGGWVLADWAFGYASYSLGWSDSSGMLNVYFANLGADGPLGQTDYPNHGITLNLDLMPTLFTYDPGTGQATWSSTWANDMGKWSSVICHEATHMIYYDVVGTNRLEGNPWLTESLAWYAGSMLWPLYQWTGTTWAVQWTIAEARTSYQYWATNWGGVSHALSWTDYGTLYLGSGYGVQLGIRGLALVGADLHNYYLGKHTYDTGEFGFTIDYVVAVLAVHPTTNAQVNAVLADIWTSYVAFDVTQVITTTGGHWQDFHYFLWGYYYAS